MNKNKYLTRIVFTNFVADYLIQKGEHFLHVRQDLKYPEKNVFVFENSETFDSNLDEGIKKQVKYYKYQD